MTNKSGESALLSQTIGMVVPQPSIMLDNSVVLILRELTNSISKREQILQSLPPGIQTAFQHIMQQVLSGTRVIELGLTAWKHAQQIAADTIMILADILSQAAVLKSNTSLTPRAAVTAAEQLAALINKLPEMVKQIVQAELARETSAGHKLTKASTALREIASLCQQSPLNSHAKMPEYLAVSVSLPLYSSEGVRAYPVYLQVYHERDNAHGDCGQHRYDTWLRLCVATEHIGMVDITFHLYEKKQFTVRATFSDIQGADLFNQHIADIHTELAQTSLQLTEITTAVKHK
jgi:hypothetical protein